MGPVITLKNRHHQLRPATNHTHTCQRIRIVIPLASICAGQYNADFSCPSNHTHTHASSGKINACLTSMLTFLRTRLVISTSRLKASFRSSLPSLRLGMSRGSGFRLPPTIDTRTLSGIMARVESSSRCSRILARSSVSGLDGSISVLARVDTLPQNDVSSRHLCGLGDLGKERISGGAVREMFEVRLWTSVND